MKNYLIVLIFLSTAIFGAEKNKGEIDLCLKLNQTDSEQAKKCYLNLCEREDQVIEACHHYGRLQSHKMTNIPAAKKYLTIACDKSYATSCLILGAVMLNYDKDQTSALKYYKKSCNLGNGKACLNAFEIAEKTKDSQGAISYHKKAVKNFDDECNNLNKSSSCMQLGRYYEKRRNRLNDGGAMALKYFKKACKLGNKWGCKKRNSITIKKIKPIKIKMHGKPSTPPKRYTMDPGGIMGKIEKQQETINYLKKYADKEPWARHLISVISMPSTPTTLSMARKHLKFVYKNGGKSFHCQEEFDKDFQFKSFKSYRPDNKKSETIFNVEWEYIVSVENFGRHFKSWKKGHSECIDGNGQAFQGRKCARKMSEKFRNMEINAINMVPSIVEISTKRIDKIYGEIEGENREFGACDLEINSEIIEPRDNLKGDVARIYRYMEFVFKLPLIGKENKKLFKIWEKQDPIDKTECDRVHIQSNGSFPMGIYRKLCGNWSKY